MRTDDAEAAAHVLSNYIRLQEVAGPDGHSAYPAMLDRALLDRQISASEADGLVTLADSLDLSRSTAEQLHIKYMTSMLAAVWEDGVITLRRQLTFGLWAISSTLAKSLTQGLVGPVIGPDEETGAAAQSLVLAAGDKVVLTGELSRALQFQLCLTTNLARTSKSTPAHLDDATSSAVTNRLSKMMMFRRSRSGWTSLRLAKWRSRSKEQLTATGITRTALTRR